MVSWCAELLKYFYCGKWCLFYELNTEQSSDHRIFERSKSLHVSEFLFSLLYMFLLLPSVVRPILQDARVWSRIHLRNMSGGPIETSIRTKITNALKPTHLQVINESTMHNVPAGAETHFKVVVVSEEFESKTPIQRHRIVNQLLDEEINNGVHALSIVTRTPKQWEESDQNIEPSPNCRGGFGK